MVFDGKPFGVVWLRTLEEGLGMRPCCVRNCGWWFDKVKYQTLNTVCAKLAMNLKLL